MEPSRATMCGARPLVALLAKNGGMAAVICRDDELFDLAAWFHKHSDRYFSRVAVVSIVNV
ncbi:hypothetical protein [Xylanibacter ruminicola]|uniref:hypothetical protein n=1 Tax=Xylanibacter ruminicola TaxID=839 RepID=UPI001114F98D|nr:hypothetical protein [Xylanibacter ruminicola]